MLLLFKIKVIGHSMEPTIADGKEILVSSLPYLLRSPKLGDIVLFQSKLHKKNFVKRIKSIENGFFFLRGDNTKDSLDSKKFGAVTRKEILGKVVFIITNSRKK